MKKKIFWTLLSGLMVLFLIPGSFAIAAGPKGKITVGSSQGTMELRKVYDPHTAIGSTPTTFKSMAFDSMVTKDEKGAFLPALAVSWEIAPDWSAISFTLRKGVKFHNGDPFTAKDVKFSLERAMREDLRFVFGSEMRRSIESVDAVDDYQVRVNLKHAYPAILDRCFEYLAIMPKDYTEKVGDDGFAAKPIGTGPFKVTKFKRDIFFDVEAVNNHYRKTPYVKTIHYMNVPEHSTRLAMLKTGEADLVMLLSTHIPNVNKDKKLRIIWSKSTYLQTMVFFDLSHPQDSPFKDIRVRRATSLAIDRQGIADAVGHGAAEPWGSFLASYHPGFDPNSKPETYDPEKAKKLMVEAGYAKGFDTTLTSHPSLVTRFEPMLQQLREVGIRCKFSVPEAGTWSKTFVASKFRGIGFGSGPWWVGRGHPAVALRSHITGGWSHKLATPAINEAMTNLEMATKEKDIAVLAKKLNDAIFESLIRLPLWANHVAFGVRPTIAEYPGVPGVVFPMNFEYLKLKGQ
ncbi:MAG: ABC transporter substrate-binding protein [Desulfobacteraceae bacterium]|nr:ABC transporter substrate-binding protein [Desulfobacteraceae bacterium]